MSRIDIYVSPRVSRPRVERGFPGVVEIVEAIAPPAWVILNQEHRYPRRDEVVLAAWAHEPSIAVVCRYCCPPNVDPGYAVWRGIEALESGTMDRPYAWRQLQLDELRRLEENESRRCRQGEGAEPYMTHDGAVQPATLPHFDQQEGRHGEEEAQADRRPAEQAAEHRSRRALGGDGEQAGLAGASRVRDGQQEEAADGCPECGEPLREEDVRYELSRDVTVEECPWLYRDYKKGERLFEYTGFLYGVVSSSGIALSDEEDTHPFFEIPRTAVDQCCPECDEPELRQEDIPGSMMGEVDCYCTACGWREVSS